MTVEGVKARQDKGLYLGAAHGGAACNFAASFLGNVALHAKSQAVVSGEPGRPGIRLDAQARCLQCGRRRETVGLSGRTSA